MFDLSTNSKVTYHPYRTAIVLDVFLKIEYHTGETKKSPPERDVWDFQQELCDIVGRRNPDNHECYTIEKDGTIIHVWFSDGRMYMGFTLQLRADFLKNN